MFVLALRMILKPMSHGMEQSRMAVSYLYIDLALFCFDIGVSWIII